MIKLFKKIYWYFRNRKVFKRIDIRLTGPICSCDTENLSWQTAIDQNRYSVLVISCGTCGTFLNIGNKAFGACFKLDKQYPNPRESKEDAKVLKLVPKSSDTPSK